MDVVTIVLLYIIALDGVRRGIDVTNGQRIHCISHLDEEHVVEQAAQHLMLRDGFEEKL